MLGIDLKQATLRLKQVKQILVTQSFNPLSKRAMRLSQGLSLSYVQSRAEG